MASDGSQVAVQASNLCFLSNITTSAPAVPKAQPDQSNSRKVIRPKNHSRRVESHQTYGAIPLAGQDDGGDVAAAYQDVAADEDSQKDNAVKKIPMDRKSTVSLPYLASSDANQSLRSTGPYVQQRIHHTGLDKPSSKERRQRN
jgi:hypothetical protein